MNICGGLFKILKLNRTYLKNGTVGFFVFENQLICSSLELPWLDNEKSTSCIKEGFYSLSFYDSPSKGRVLLLKNERLGVGTSQECERTYIEIHSANWTSQIEGCIATGLSVGIDSTDDSRLMAYNSKDAFTKLMAFVEAEEIKLLHITS